MTVMMTKLEMIHLTFSREGAVEIHYINTGMFNINIRLFNPYKSNQPHLSLDVWIQHGSDSGCVLALMRLWDGCRVFFIASDRVFDEDSSNTMTHTYN